MRFPAASREEGCRLAQAIEDDMRPTEGYLDHQVIRDVDDPGHLLAITRRGTRPRADTVLAVYATHSNVQRAAERLSGPPGGFVGDVVTAARVTPSPSLVLGRARLGLDDL